MEKSLLILIFVFVIRAFVQGAPTPEAPVTDEVTTEGSVTLLASYDDSLLHPHVVTIARLESLLKKAGEIFRPSMNLNQEIKSQTSLIPVPYEQMQPPSEQPYNFYLPLYDVADDSTSLSSKPNKMEKIAPPLKSSKASINFSEVVVKPKKSPKKFDPLQKHINMKWLNSYEKETGEVPKAAYLENDEKNRINFNDSFFAVDMLIKSPDNNPHKEHKTQENHQDYGQNDEGEDLMAAAAAQLAEIIAS